MHITVNHFVRLYKMLISLIKSFLFIQWKFQNIGDLKHLITYPSSSRSRFHIFFQKVIH